MHQLSTLRKARPLWLTALLLTMPTAVLQTPSHAALDTKTINFKAAIVGATCTFGTPTEGLLAVNTDGDIITTEPGIAAGAARTTIDYTASFENAVMTVDQLVLTGSDGFNGGGTLFLSRNTGSSVSSTEGSVELRDNLPLADTLSIGASFVSTSGPIPAGTYGATARLTCAAP